MPDANLKVILHTCHMWHSIWPGACSMSSYLSVSVRELEWSREGSMWSQSMARNISQKPPRTSPGSSTVCPPPALEMPQTQSRDQASRQAPAARCGRRASTERSPVPKWTSLSWRPSWRRLLSPAPSAAALTAHAPPQVSLMIVSDRRLI